MDVLLTRNIYNGSFTLGVLQIENFNCFVLEPPVRIMGEVVPDMTAIPAGIYGLVFYQSPKFNRNVILLTGTPEAFGAIEIHPGNTPKDTHGCLIPGETFRISNDNGAYVGPSTAMCEKIYYLLSAAIDSGNANIKIVDTFQAVA